MNEKLLFDETFLQKLERLTVLSRRILAGQSQGERRSPKRGQSVEFTDYRSYLPGDDFRRIDWNAYARLERLFLKLFVEEEEQTVQLLIDTSRSMNWGQPNKFEYAIRIAGALGYITLVSLDRVSVTALGNDGNRSLNYFPPSRGKNQAIPLFSFLQSLKTNGGNPINQLDAFLKNTKQAGIVLLLSDFLGDGWMEGVNKLSSRGFEVTVIQILSPDEVTPEHEGDLTLLDSETEETVEITADVFTMDRYKHWLFEWQDSWQRFCNSRSVNFISIETNLSIENLLFSWLRLQGVLK